MSLGDLCTGRLTYQEVGAMIMKLPSESAYQTEILDRYTDEELAELAKKKTGYGAWSQTDMLLASVIDAVNGLTHVQIARAGVKADPPEPLPRPGVVSKARQADNPQATAFLQAIRDRHAKEQAAEGESS